MIGVSPLTLGIVHGGVRVLDQGADVFTVGGEKTDADAGRDEDLVAGYAEGLAEQAEYLFGDGCRITRGIHIVQQQDELVAAHARHGVAGTHMLA